MIDHIKLPVGDYARSRAFFTAALAPLGYRMLIERGGREAGFGADFPHFWIAQSEAPTPAHAAIRARDRAAVAAFHRAALEAGGTDNGAPGMRSHYHPGYFSAFVLDPDEHNIEAVWHGAGSAP
ncbi:MAG TPA: VOC family protein [Solirubrobacteraceae bacterium]|nr:VOC family protein [Solirubrobacteraceae bacterium]